MGLLSTWGKIIIVLSVIGFLDEIYSSVEVHNALAVVISIIVLSCGIYLGYLGVRVDEESQVDRTNFERDKIRNLEKRIEALEQPLHIEHSQIRKTCPYCFETISYLQTDSPPPFCPHCKKELPRIF